MTTRNLANLSPWWHIAVFFIPFLLDCFSLASAATITITNTNDSGAGPLPQAISDSSPGDTIDFDSRLNGQTITLTSGELLINLITGPDANHGNTTITNTATVSSLSDTRIPPIRPRR